jgi:uncharacterized membrane protein YhhN
MTTTPHTRLTLECDGHLLTDALRHRERVADPPRRVRSRAVSGAEVVLVVAAVVIAPVNWVSVRYGGDVLRGVTKAAVLALLVVAAIVAPADHTLVQVLVVLALAFSLAGDVALLREELFIFGLVWFLLAHLLYTAAVLTEPDWVPVRAGIGGALALLVVVMLGSRLDRSLHGQPSALRYGVRAYTLVIVTMLVVAWSAGPLLMASGAAFFVASDSLLGWNRFVEEDERLRLVVMPTYHVGQVLMMLGLLHRLN